MRMSARSGDPPASAKTNPPATRVSSGRLGCGCPSSGLEARLPTAGKRPGRLGLRSAVEEITLYDPGYPINDHIIASLAGFGLGEPGISYVAVGRVILVPPGRVENPAARLDVLRTLDFSHVLGNHMVGRTPRR